MTGFYKFVSSLAALLVVPLFSAYSGITGKKRRGLAHHFGVLPTPPPPGVEFFFKNLGVLCQAKK